MTDSDFHRSAESCDLKPCPFCGGTSIDPAFWATVDYCGPGCDDCGATAETAEKWNDRMSDDAQPTPELQLVQWLQGYLGCITGRDELSAFEANTIRSKLAETVAAQPPAAPVEMIETGPVTVNEWEDARSSAGNGGLRERIGRALYECEKRRGEHATAVLREASPKAGGVLLMDPWEKCSETFLSDADAVIAVLNEPQPTPVTAEAKARAAGWIAEIEYNDEDDGVRHPESGNWAEDWEGACRQIGAAK